MKLHIGLFGLFGLCLLAACDFGATRTVLDDEPVNRVRTFAGAHDGIHGYASHDPLELHQFDMNSGAVTASINLPPTDDILALTAAVAEDDAAWALSSSGRMTKWRPGPIAVETRTAQPVPPGVTREYCDISAGVGGRIFTTSVDHFPSGPSVVRIFRYNADGTFLVTNVAGQTRCPKIAVDALRGEVLVLPDFGKTVKRYDLALVSTGSLTLLSSPSKFQGLWDIDGIGGWIFATGNNSGPTLESDPMVWVFDLDDGSTADWKSTEGGRAVQITYEAINELVEGSLASSTHPSGYGLIGYELVESN